eukprot:TRINITY_DN16361_c0_g1_i1.p1 TRINITY_DN16361_c0_g1~~TRINITY_DN16361_c0_g1_i1.p1  ORF type:complete len:382 (+),score=93.88 TRINITY_DN16361_c0_g1_i1:214-1359(+)
MTCRQAAAGGYCDYSTGSGHVGTALCPKSCNKCPPRPRVATEPGAHFRDPHPARTHGTKGSRPDVAAALPPSQEEPVDESAPETAAPADNAPAAADDADDETAHCTDDPVWTDDDNDGCQVYAAYIKKGSLTLDQACGYNDGLAKVHCRKTCGTCDVESQDVCADKECVTRFKETFGKCIACGEWKAMCGDAGFRADCPRTCGVCSSTQREPPKQDFVASKVIVEPTPTTTTTTPDLSSPPPICDDHTCVDAWLNKTGKCFKCKDHAKDFCGRDADFMASCPRSCKMCNPKEEPVCEDSFKVHTCKRLASWGLCRSDKVLSQCKATCGVCQAVKDARSEEHAQKHVHDHGQHKKSGASARAQPVVAILVAFGAAMILVARS